VTLRDRGLAAATAGVALALLVAGPAAAQDVLGPGGCSNAKCHVTQGTWWNADAHRGSLNKYNQFPQYSQMAERYGIAAGDTKALNEKCHSCHATVALPAETPDYGVSCESCHGPGKTYLESHQREGFQAGTDGLLKLADMSVRADACVRCHFCTDQKLLDIGHPPGWPRAGTYGSKSSTVARPPDHWKEFLPDVDADPAPFEAALKRTGFEPSTAAPLAAAVAGGPGEVRTITVIRGIFPLTNPPVVQPLDLEAPAPLPEDATTLEILTALQRRLQYLYRRLDETYPE
jgi:hypothetical protein